MGPLPCVDGGDGYVLVTRVGSPGGAYGRRTPRGLRVSPLGVRGVGPPRICHDPGRTAPGRVPTPDTVYGSSLADDPPLYSR